tara:strand:+ start:335 stop:472 length:138 start_codon:yes stop_codon:yes gene_type:complete
MPCDRLQEDKKVSGSIYIYIIHVEKGLVYRKVVKKMSRGFYKVSS